MPQSSAFADHLSATDLKRLDALARKRRQTRSHLLQNDEDQGRHEVEALRSAVEAQETFIERSGSIADEHRRF